MIHVSDVQKCINTEIMAKIQDIVLEHGRLTRITLGSAINILVEVLGFSKLPARLGSTTMTQRENKKLKSGVTQKIGQEKVLASLFFLRFRS